MGMSSGRAMMSKEALAPREPGMRRLRGEEWPEMNGESTAPLPVIVPAPADLLAVSERVLAELEENRRLTRLAIAGQPDETALAMSALRLADMQVEWRDGIKAIRLAAVANALDDTVAGVIASRLAAVPEPRHRHRKGTSRQRAPGEGQLKLWRVPSLVLVAFAALKRLAPHVSHAKLVAAVTTVGTGGVALAVTGAVVITSSHSGVAASGSGSSSSAPGWHTSATPIPSSSLIAHAVTHPKAKRSKKGETLLAAGGLLPTYGPAPAPSSSPSSPSASPVVSAAVGDAAIGQLTFSTLNLSNPLVPSVKFTLTATGTAGWVSWRIDTTGTDLDFSADHGSGTHGVLNAGESVVITVSVDAAQALDGNTEQVFSIGNQSVSVSMPSLVSLPSVAPSVLPSVLPSI